MPPKRRDCYEPFKEDELLDYPCWTGMDLAIVDDLCAAVHVFPWGEENEELYRVIARHWLPHTTMRRMRDVVGYEQWADEGWLTVTDGDEVDFGRIVDDLAIDAQKFRIQDLRYDRAYGATVAQTLEIEYGVTRKEFPQTIMHYTYPAKMLERLIRKRAIRHNGNPLLTWQIGHARVKTDVQNNIRVVKPKDDDHRKVDGVQAMLMALSGAIGEQPEGKSFYEDNDLEFI